MSGFSDLLRLNLSIAGISQRDFAASLGLSHGLVGMICTGDRSPPLENIEKWADFFGLKDAEKARFCDLAAIAHLPVEVQSKFETWYHEHKQLKADYVELLKRVNAQRVADG